jgi:Tfp pilus assembly protein PilV
MLEVLLAGIVLSVCCICMLDAMVTTTSETRQSGEYAAAVSAARKKLEEITACSLAKVVANYGINAPLIGRTFPVYLNESVESQNGNTKQRGQVLPGYYKTVNGNANTDAGEIVIVTNESALASTYGLSCSIDGSTSGPNAYPDNGQPGGINFTGIPIDLDCDGVTSSGTSGNKYDLSTSPQITSAVRLPVGVIVRWPGAHGQERVEIWTLVSRY